MKTSIILLASFFLSLSSMAQVSQQWVARYNGLDSSIDRGNDVTVDNQGNVYVTGVSQGDTTSLDIITIKYNSSGIEIWSVLYRGPGFSEDQGLDIVVDVQGNVYVLGQIRASGGNRNYVTIKYNSAGIEQWVKIYNGPANLDDLPSDLSLDNQGNIYVTGSSSGNGTLSDFATIKYNSTGVEQWVARYDGPVSRYDGANALAVDDQGNIYVTGNSEFNSTGSNINYVTIKYNSAGVEQWIESYDGSDASSEVANDITLDDQGNVYITGHSADSLTGLDYATIKYNSAGVQQWVAIYNGPGDEAPYGIVVDGQGNSFITGYDNPGLGGPSDIITVKYNSSGVEQWVKKFNGAANSTDRVYDIALDAQSNVYVVGASVGAGFFEDYITVKYSSDGTEQWAARYEGPASSSDLAFALTLDASGNIYVVGQSNGIGTGSDLTTIKYTQTVGIHHISSEIPKGLELSQNYPNPFNPSTKIKFAIPSSSFVKLAVYDILGREVSSLVNEQLQPGTYEYEFEASALNSGVYFYKIFTENFSEVKKMLLVK